MDARRRLILRFYKALDAKDVDAVMALVHPDADLPDQLDGARLQGAAAIRAYYQRAFGMIIAESTPVTFQDGPDDSLDVRVHHHVTSLEGGLWADEPSDYRFLFRDGLIARCDQLNL